MTTPRLVPIVAGLPANDPIYMPPAPAKAVA